MIDLRSDTVTRPTDAMLHAMVHAEVGDDMMGEDPTVNRLEAMIADMLGMESAVFACSGTQSNQMGVRVHCLPGDELLINSTSHIVNYEGGAAAALSGVSCRTIMAPRGLLDIENLSDKPNGDDQHLCRTRLVCLENTTNAGGGHVYSLDQLQRVSAWARRAGLKLHLDGARLFNATVAGGYSPEEVGASFDTVSICFSKGLGCPMGSILVGSADDIKRARRIRKLFGGALRQAGIVAAAAIYALENNIDRLADDHKNARQLAHTLTGIDGIQIEPDDVQSNLVFFEIAPGLGTAAQLGSAAEARGVLLCPFGGQRVRAVTHLDVSADDIHTVAAVISEALKDGIANESTHGTGPHAE